MKPWSRKAVQWTCDQCPDGYLHSWSARVDNRFNGSGCPQCRGRKVCKHNSLATKAPAVAAQWDYEANDNTPDDVVPQSENLLNGFAMPVVTNGQQGLVLKSVTTVAAPCALRLQGRNASSAQLLQSDTDLAQWAHERNADENNYPDNTTLQSHKQIHWVCTKCPAGQKHCWSAKPCDRTGSRKTGCPFCSGRVACKCNSLQGLYPDIAAEWDHGKNDGQPRDYPTSSHRLAWWLSPQQGSWQQTINSRTNGVLQRTARLRHVQQMQSPTS